MKLRAYVPILACLALLPLTGCVNRDAQAQAKRTQAVLDDPVIPVTVETVATRPFIEMLEITGALTSSDDTQVTATVAGRLIRVLVKDGDSVTAGQVIAVQDLRDYQIRLSQAQSQLDGALAALRQAQSDAVEGPRRSSSAVRAARAQLASAEANLLKARNGARSEERRQAEAQLQAARVNLEIAQKDVDRGQRLLAEGAISERDFDRYRQQFAAAKAQYDGAVESVRIVQNATRVEDVRALEGQVSAAREQLQTVLASQRQDAQYRDRVEQARAQVQSAQSQVDLARDGLGNAQVRAPFSGRIAGKPLQVGSFAGPGTPIVRLVSSEGIYLEGEIPEVQISAIRTGMPVTISLDALKDRFFSGQIAAINPQAESLGRLFKVRVQLDGLPAELRAGMFARGKVELNRREGVITVPASAIVREGDGTYVYLVNGAKAVKRAVKLGLAQDGRVEVTGLSAGEQLVVRGQTLLKADTPIRLDTAKAEDAATPPASSQE